MNRGLPVFLLLSLPLIYASLATIGVVFPGLQFLSEIVPIPTFGLGFAGLNITMFYIYPAYCLIYFIVILFMTVIKKVLAKWYILPSLLICLLPLILVVFEGNIPYTNKYGALSIGNNLDPKISYTMTVDKNGQQVINYFLTVDGIDSLPNSFKYIFSISVIDDKGVEWPLSLIDFVDSGESWRYSVFRGESGNLVNNTVYTSVLKTRSISVKNNAKFCISVMTEPYTEETVRPIYEKCIVGEKLQ